DTCGRVCDRAPPEPSGPDPITLCREQCKGQGEAEACMKFCIRRWDKGTLSGPSDDTVRSALMERKEAEFRGSNQDVHDTDLRENLDERYTSIESHFGNASVARGWRNTLIGLDLLPLGSYPQVTIENEERTYDYYGRLSATRTTTTKNYEGSEEEFTRETFIEYGSLGEVMEIRETTVTGGIDLDETTVTDIHYDDEGRVTGYTYTEVTDEGGTREITVTISYDDDGKVTSVQIEDTTDSEDVGETDITDISYDDDGRMKGYRQTVKRAGSTLEFICGDGTCSVPFESVHRCLVDCAICGDSICSFPFEDDGTCGADCDRWGDSRQG
ncbi:MAG: hypothetical protein QGG26_07885, partial [Candidatus Undinarchaeales archaeon]|nr:hypothetical protein [Candidatus Undinarchaeales archaeon]